MANIKIRDREKKTVISGHVNRSFKSLNTEGSIMLWSPPLLGNSKKKKPHDAIFAKNFFPPTPTRAEDGYQQPTILYSGYIAPHAGHSK